MTSGIDAAALVQGVEPSRQLERVEAVERLRGVIQHEVQVLKSAGAGSLAVMLRPDAGTELFVQLTRNGDQIEAFVRVEKGDSIEFRQNWERLQATLADQQVRLLPLQSSDPNTPRRESNQHDGHTFADARQEQRDASGRRPDGRASVHGPRMTMTGAEDASVTTSARPTTPRATGLDSWA